MSEKLKDIIKPTFIKVILAVLFLTWQYFYSFRAENIFLLKDLAVYLGTGLSGIGWGNFFVKNLSLLGIWFVLALIIYAAILAFETAGNAFHNFRVRATYQNQKPDDYKHLLKTRNIFLKTHLLSYLLWTGAIILIVFGFSWVSGLVESFRFGMYDNLFWNIAEGGGTLDYNSTALLTASFVILLPLWYLYSAFLMWVFKEGRFEEEKDKLEEEHFAVVVEDEPEKDKEA